MSFRGLLTSVPIGVLAAFAVAVPASAHIPRTQLASGVEPPQKIIFPVVGHVSYSDDFGAPRAQGGHPGNDILAARRAPVVAVEPGRVVFWTTSASAGCMLYLYGHSGTTYQYIHLNNDLTRRNDNRGSCVAGVAYAAGLQDGDEVRAGELIGYVGDSGDADGRHPHLHFELHPGGGQAISPYPWLVRAERLAHPT
jgi:murein DD-endopeptidase MepM/ murein hydrolase activator NlpD